VGIRDDVPTGQYGIEGRFDEDLSGEQGYIMSERDTGGALIASGDRLLEEAIDGDDVILTIDKTVQYQTCKALKEAIEKHEAKKGSVIIMDPKTGAIIAMCNYPAYDPNVYSEVEEIQVFNNDVLTDMYEPGSVFKTFALGSALDMEKISPSTTYEDTGVVNIDGYSIHNSDGKSNGVVDMSYVLSESLNTGSIFAVNQIGNEKWEEYVQNFGFGEYTDIQLTGEQAGNITSLAKHADIYSATSSYGQGITVTPLQLVNAYAAIANDGKLMKPYIIDEIVKDNGYSTKTEPVEIRQVVSAKTTSMLGGMLVNVIDNGHAKLAKVEGYYMAGKTGTAQVPLEDGPGYDEERHKDTFVGFGPVSDPKFVMLTKIDEPSDVPWSALSAAPLWGEIAQFLVEYYHIPPER